MAKANNEFFLSIFYHKTIITVRYYLSLESLPSTSRIMIFDGVSTLNHIPLVVCPTRCLRLRTSKSVPKRAFKRVLLPELWDPMMETIWYCFEWRRWVYWARVYSYSMLNHRGGTGIRSRHRLFGIFSGLVFAYILRLYDIGSGVHVFIWFFNDRNIQFLIIERNKMRFLDKISRWQGSKYLINNKKMIEYSSFRMNERDYNS